eukprot:179250_1
MDVNADIFWMIIRPLMGLLLCVHSIVPQYQINALLDIYDALNGDKWECKWNVTQIENGNLFDECNIIYTQNISNDVEVVYALDLASIHYTENVECAIPSNIYNLTTLTYLSMSGTNIYGKIDHSIGNLTNLNYLWINNISLNGRIPDTICNLRNLIEITVENVNITAIPFCIFNNENLSYAFIDNTDSIIKFLYMYLYNNDNIVTLHLEGKYNSIGPIPESISYFTRLKALSIAGYFNGTIPTTLCNLSVLETLSFHDLSEHLVDIIPDCIFENHHLHTFQLENTFINGSIPSSFCTHNGSLTDFWLNNNTNLKGVLPECNEATFRNLYMISVVSNPKLMGSIPSTYLCTPQMSFIQISDNDIMKNNRIPDCWKYVNMTSKFLVLNLENGNFVGSIPKLNAPKLEQIFLGDNEITGSVSNFISNIDINQLQYLVLHNNKFVESDITGLLKDLFVNGSNLEILSLYGNHGIKGGLPDFDDLFIDNHTEYMLIHSCNIYGTIPSTLRFGSQLKKLSLFDNRLSCLMPNEFTYKNSTSLVISSNLFQTDKNDKLPDWISTYFVSASNLYITMYNNIMSIIAVIISCLAFLIHLIIKYIRKNYKDHSNKIDFIEDIELFQSKFSDWKLLLLLLGLLILYALSSSYFECTPLLSWFSLSWFYTDNKNSLQNWTLLITTSLIHWFFCAYYSKIIYISDKQ